MVPLLLMHQTSHNPCQQSAASHVALQADVVAWFPEVHALWLGHELYAEQRVADVVQEVGQRLYQWQIRAGTANTQHTLQASSDFRADCRSVHRCVLHFFLAGSVVRRCWSLYMQVCEFAAPASRQCTTLADLWWRRRQQCGHAG
jgi:hypothetical protein